MAKNITDIIKARIKNYQQDISYEQEGKVISISDGLAIVSGLSDAEDQELLLFPQGSLGIAINLEEDIISVILLENYSHINEGDPVKKTGIISSIGVGDEYLGRVVNAMGRAIDGKNEIKTKKRRDVERIAPGIMTRESVSQPLETGIMAIDSMIPIGKGQRELIIGDKKTGKTAIIMDTILNQKGKNVKCVYVSIGQKNSSLVNTIQALEAKGAMEYTTIVSANASDSDAMQFLAPFSGMAIAEEWMENGDDVLIAFDDLSKHAVAYRTISLLTRRPPGREAYPGDVFYLHSRLLERAAKLNKKYGGGSITALPIIETQEGDISAYIPTNVISITDGQIFLMVDAFNYGQRPAVDVGLSVSRVGSSAQTNLMKKASAQLKLVLAHYEEVKIFSQFSADADPEVKQTLKLGEITMFMLRQDVSSPIPQTIQAILLFMTTWYKKTEIYNIPLERVFEFKRDLIEYIKTDKNFKPIYNLLEKNKDIDKATEEKLLKILISFSAPYKVEPKKGKKV